MIGTSVIKNLTASRPEETWNIYIEDSFHIYVITENGSPWDCVILRRQSDV